MYYKDQERLLELMERIATALEFIAGAIDEGRLR